MKFQRCFSLGIAFGLLLFERGEAKSESWQNRETDEFIESYCLDCHDSEMEEGDFNLETLGDELSERELFEKWVMVHDRVRAGEMPPKKKRRPDPEDQAQFLKQLNDALVSAGKQRVERDGRAKVRRLNRFEYENSLREGLQAPWLQVADMLPEDGTSHLFNKSGERLDISHVQMMKYLETAEYALRMALQTVAHPAETNRFYAREERSARGYLRWRPGIQTAATRASIPLIGTTPQPEVIRGNEPLTVGDADPELREREAVGYVSGTYTATTKYDFTRMKLPVDGRYRLRMKSYTFLAGTNGASGGNDHGLTGGNKKWWRPDRNVAHPGNRSEPITLYALADSGDSRWLANFDSHPEPSITEHEVFLKRGEKIRPDATRLVRTRPGWRGNPNATTNGIPGFAMNWLEVEGPLHEQWPPACYTAMFDDLRFEVDEDKNVKVVPNDPDQDARRLLIRFMRTFLRDPFVEEKRVEPFFTIYQRARELGEDFTDALISGFSAILCSGDFLFLEMQPGKLTHPELASRLSFFLWNGPPDEQLLHDTNLLDPRQLGTQVERLLNDERSDRFVNTFLDYWLDLRDINANAPDAELYPDYYLDDWLTESSVFETRRFVRTLIDEDLPARNLVDAGFAFVNERLADLYDLDPLEGGEFHRVDLPDESGRGGLLTQASVLRVTANGTTTSPVIRGAWIMERIMGLHIPPPPSGVEAVTPDIRGATTIREQIEKHTSIASCRACHVKFDPVGLALEGYDIAGGARERYRAVGDEGEPVDGIGKNGHLFKFNNALPVDSSGELSDGAQFNNINELKQHFLKDERAIARNWVNQLVVYSTGAPVTFADRVEVERILDAAEPEGYRMRTLIHGVVASPLFLRK